MESTSIFKMVKIKQENQEIVETFAPLKFVVQKPGIWPQRTCRTKKTYRQSDKGLYIKSFCPLID